MSEFMSELRLQEANVVWHAIGFPHGAAIEIEYDKAMRTETLRVLRNPEIRTVEKLGPGRLWQGGEDEPLVDISIGVRKIVSKRRKSTVPDTTAFEAPGGVGVIENEAVFMAPEPGVNA